jgi:hypothetical protein
VEEQQNKSRMMRNGKLVERFDEREEIKLRTRKKNKRKGENKTNGK